MIASGYAGRDQAMSRLYCKAVALSVLIATGLLAVPAPAAWVSLTRSTREATSAEVAGGASGMINDFFVSSDSDLLSVSDVVIDSPLFQDALGSDRAAPHDALAALSPTLGADSFITMPSDTVVLGGGFEGPGSDKLWGDLSDDGPQHNFHFARLTTNQTGSFAGRVGFRSGAGPAYLPFRFTLAGSAADVPLLDRDPSYSLEYSLEAPAAPPIAPPPPYVPPVPSVPPGSPVDPPAEPVPPLVPPAVPPAPAPAPGGRMGLLTLARTSREVTPAEIAGGAPVGGLVHEFRVTSDADLLSVNRVSIDVPLFQDALGIDNAAPNVAQAALSSGMTADSFITLPSDTLVLGGGFANSGGENLWGDLSNDGAQQDFLFARLTTDQAGTFSGNISLRGDSSPVTLPFSFPLPDVADSTTTVSIQYALDPPPPVEPVPAPAPPVGPTLPPIDPALPPVDPTFPPVDPVLPIDPLPPVAGDPPIAGDPPVVSDPPIVGDPPIVSDPSPRDPPGDPVPGDPSAPPVDPAPPAPSDPLPTEPLIYVGSPGEVVLLPWWTIDIDSTMLEPVTTGWWRGPIVFDGGLPTDQNGQFVSLIDVAVLRDQLGAGLVGQAMTFGNVVGLADSVPIFTFGGESYVAVLREAAAADAIVPEPASALLASLAAVFGLHVCQQRRRRRV
jgi:hypothetical protein